MFSKMKAIFRGLGKKFSLLSGTIPGALDCGDPGLECGAQLGRGSREASIVRLAVDVFGTPAYAEA
jgi:hypothetical protein